MTREIEKTAGIPVVQIATIVPIMLTVGANRMSPVWPSHPWEPRPRPRRRQGREEELVLRAFKAMKTGM